jgi:hypothetical protein
MFVLLVALMYGEKEGFESFDDQNLFLFYRFDWTQYFRSLPATNAVFPSLVIELKVTGIFANEPIHHVFIRSGLLSKVRIDR